MKRIARKCEGGRNVVGQNKLELTIPKRMVVKMGGL